MKNFRHWGIRVRRDLARNYYAIWDNLETIRMDLGEETKLPYQRSEFYDVGVTSRCNSMCPFCYVSAGKNGEDFKDIIETWNAWMATFPEDIPIDIRKDDILQDILKKPRRIENLTLDEFELKLKMRLHLKAKTPMVYTEKPYQIAIGSVGEGTIHLQFPEFLESVYNSRVVPNYTTNGILLAGNGKQTDKLLDYTRNFVGGVAVSYGNEKIRLQEDKAIERLLKNGECKVMIHHLISDKESVNKLLDAEDKWGKDVHYHVLLPLKKHGRSTEEMTEEAFLYLTEKIREKNLTNLAFGMWFLPWMKKYPGRLNVWDYPEETYSSNMLINNGKIDFTPSSYNLKVAETWKIK